MNSYCIAPRCMKSELNILSKADGSALLAQGNTVVLATLFGPLEVKHAKIQSEGLPICATFRHKSGKPGLNEKTFEAILQSACEALLFTKQFSRVEISIIVQELQDCGSMLATAINAACLAVINSGLRMKCTVAAVTCAIGDANNFVIDPDQVLSEKAKMIMTVCYESVSCNIVAVHVEGMCNLEEHEKALELCKLTATNIFDYYKSIVKKYSGTLIIK